MEALASLVPGLGPFLAVFVNRMMGSSFERRTKKILSEMRDDLVRLEQSGRASFTPELAESDEFQAATHRTLRRLLESGSDEKRKLLRNALLNRVLGTDDADQFERALDSCDSIDVRVLKVMDGVTRPPGRSWRRFISPEHIVRNEFERSGWAEPGHLETRVGMLTSLGLLKADEKTHVRERDAGPWTRDRASRAPDQIAERTVTYAVSDFGADFLAYLSDPFDSVEDDGAPVGI